MGKLYENIVGRETTNRESNEKILSAYDKMLAEANKKAYKIEKKEDGLWYIIYKPDTGPNKGNWMTISSGHKDKKYAQKLLDHQKKVNYDDYKNVGFTATSMGKKSDMKVAKVGKHRIPMK